MNIVQFVGTLKSKCALMIFDRYTNLKYKYGSRNFWYWGHFVNTVGKNVKIIQDYIQNQLERRFGQRANLFQGVYGPVYWQQEKVGKKKTAAFSGCL